MICFSYSFLAISGVSYFLAIVIEGVADGGFPPL